MLYCPANESFNQIWVNHGTSQCFMETVSNSVTYLFMLIFGSIQLLIYKKHGTIISNAPLPRNKLYKLQVFVTFLFPAVTVVRFLLQAFVLNDKVIYGYMVSN